MSCSGTLWFLPSQNVLQPDSCSTCAIVAHSAGSRPLQPGKPCAPSVMHEHALRWWLRPVRNVERVGEQSAVVCHCEYMRPRSASFCSVGMLMPPPNGDHAASPVSSYRMIRMFGAPFGACANENGSQSGLESRISSLMTPLNRFLAMASLLFLLCAARPPHVC